MNSRPFIEASLPESERPPENPGHPGTTMAEALRAFPTAVEVINGESIPIHPEVVAPRALVRQQTEVLRKRAAQELPLFPHAISRAVSEARANDAYWSQQARR